MIHDQECVGCAHDTDDCICAEYDGPDDSDMTDEDRAENDRWSLADLRHEQRTDR